MSFPVIDRWLLASVLIIICIVSLSGQPPVFTYLREQEGLNDNIAWSSNTLHIDQHGFVWIATQSGLNRFDGDQIRSFNGIGLAPYDLPYNIITAIAEDRNGTLWLGTQEEGIILYNPFMETFTNFDSRGRLPDSLEFTQINKLVPDQKGNMLICTAFQGLFRYDSEADTLQKIRINRSDYTDKSINTILQLKDGRLVALAHDGIYLQEQTDTFKRFAVDHSIFLYEAFQMPDGTVRIITQNTLYHFILDPMTSQLTTQQNLFSKNICNCVVDPDDNLWTNAHEGLLIKETLASGKTETYTISADVNDQSMNICIRGTHADDKGRIYYTSLGTGAGRWHYDEYPFKIVVPRSTQRIKMFNGDLYLAMSDSLMKYNHGELSLTTLKKKSSGNIFDFLVDRDGSYWVQYDQPIPVFSHFNRDGNHLNSTESGRMFSQLLQLENGQLTIGNKKNSRDENIQYEFIGSIYEKLSGQTYPDFRVKYYTQLRNGDVWMATFAKGIIRLTDNLTRYEMMSVDVDGNGKLNSNNPFYIYEARDGHVLVCTDKGINVWDPNTETFSYIKDDNVEVLDIKGMIEGKDGVIWILMQSNIWRYDVNDGSVGEFKLHPDFTAAIWAPADLVVDKDGYLYYQGTTGVVRVDPEMLEKQPAPETVLFTDLYVDRKRIFPGDASGLLDTSILFQRKLEVRYAYRDVGFSFVSPHGRDVNATYYYKLDGYRDEWNEAPADRTIHFTSLTPGHYRFEVKARSGNGKWTANTSVIGFHIAPPWFQRWWAYVLYALAASSVAYAFYRYRVNELLKYQALRTKISSDLHDDVGTILGSIAMESEMLAYESDPENASLLQRLSQLSREAMGRMRDTVWAIDSRKDNLEFLTDRMKDYLAETLSRTPFSYTWEDTSDMQNKSLAPDIRQNVYLIFKEAINNILKHSQGHNVKVSLAKEKSRCILTIKNDGMVEKQKHGSGLGLSNMRLRAETIGADLSIHTQDGFEVILKFDISSGQRSAKKNLS